MSRMIKPEDRTPYVKEMVRRFHDHVYHDDGTTCSYEEYADYLFILNAPRAHGVEDEMLEYAKQHEEATIRQLSEYFDIVSEGKAPIEDPNEVPSEWE